MVVQHQVRSVLGYLSLKFLVCIEWSGQPTDSSRCVVRTVEPIRKSAWHRHEVFVRIRDISVFIHTKEKFLLLISIMLVNSGIPYLKFILERIDVEVPLSRGPVVVISLPTFDISPGKV